MKATVLQGRVIDEKDTALIRGLVERHPHWSRRRLSIELSQLWNWRNAAGQLKDMAARTLLGKLERRGLVQLPARRQTPSIRMGGRTMAQVSWDQQPIECSLAGLIGLNLQEISSQRPQREIFASALAEFHYQGFKGTVGENLQYVVQDGSGRMLACLLFGSSAWKCQERDQWIGWSREQREKNLNLTTNNTRFLILPWVKVPHLASWSLGQVLTRLARDWQSKYGHPILLVETFVERDRFKGTAYRAANWVQVGSTRGRSRQDRHQTLRVPVKDIYLHPLRWDFQKGLCA